MKTKLKKCGGCNKDRVLWKSKSRDKDGNVVPGLCKECVHSFNGNIPEGKYKPLKKPIKTISDKKAIELKEYRRLRDAYLKKHPNCEICSSRRDITLHHKRPRAYFLCDVSIFMSLCQNCHNKVHDNDAWARENGYLLSKH